MMRSRPAPASRANSASSAAKNGLDTPFDTYQNTSPEIGWTKAVTYNHLYRWWPSAMGRPHPPDDRLQPNAVFVGGPDLNRFVRVLCRFLRDHRGQLFLNVSHSSGVAAAGWRGRGFCTDQLIALSASQPRCGKTAARPSSPAIQAATLGPVHKPPSGGGSSRRALSLSSRSGLRTEGLVPFRRRRSPRACGPWAL